jgi:hypothetical protein
MKIPLLPQGEEDICLSPVPMKLFLIPPPRWGRIEERGIF